MIKSIPFSSQIQTQFHFSSNSYNSSVLPSKSNHISFNFGKLHLITAPISFRTIPNAPPNVTNNGFYTPSPEETFYDLLGVTESGTLSEIKRAYKQMALKYHPDASPADRAEEHTVMFMRIQEAYETLSDPVSRAMYDCYMAKGVHLAFTRKKESRFKVRSEEKTWWKASWQVQVAELKRRRTVEQGVRMSWGARIRKQRGVARADASVPDQQGSVWRRG